MSNGVFDSNSEFVPAVSASGTFGADGVDASSDTGSAITAISGNPDAVGNPGGAAVFAQAFNGVGVHAISGTDFTTSDLPQAGVFAEGGQFAGVYATNGIGDVGAVDVADAAVHAVSAGTSPSSSVPTDLQTAMFAEGGIGFGVIATAGPTEAQLGTPQFEGEIGGIGLAVNAQNYYGAAIAATSVYGNAVNASIASLTDADPPLPPGVPTPAPGFCIQAINHNPQLAILASSPGASECVKALSGSGAGVVGLTGGEFIDTTTSDGVHGVTTGVSGSSSSGVHGETQSLSGAGVTADGGTVPRTSPPVPLGATALQVINGTIKVQGNSVGTVTMSAGKTALTVDNAAATAASLILLTPLENPQAFLWIGARHAGSFTIEASKALPKAVTITFLIIN